MASLTPLPKMQLFDSSGVPLNGGKLYTYVAGTSTPKATYTDSSGNTANTNPVILDSAGRANIWLEGNYKMILADSSDSVIWTVDNVSGLPSDLPVWITVTGTDALFAVPDSAITTYQARQNFYFVAVNTNTSAVTLNVSGLGAKNVTKNYNAALVAGDIKANSIVQVVYDGTQFQLINISNLASLSGGTFTGTVNMSGAAFNTAAFVDVASASTTNIGAAASNNVRITGTTTITSFGTAAAGVIRNLRFASALTLTYNATSLILPTSANIATVEGDTCVVASLGSGNWVVTQYQRFNGAPLQVYQSSVGGLLISSIAGSATTASLSVSAGMATNSTNSKLINSTGNLSWSVSNGNAANGYQGGTNLPANDTIHVFVTSGPSGEASFAHNGLTPTLRPGYTDYRRIGSFNTDSGGAPIPYTSIEIGGGATLNYLTTQTLDVSVTNQGTSRTQYILNVPTDIKVMPIGRAVGNSTGTIGIILTSGDETDVAAVNSNIFTVPLTDLAGTTVTSYMPLSNMVTNTSGQIGARASSANGVFYIVTRGWIDFRR